MFVDKIKNKKSGILLYGITPPKIETTEERVQEIAEKTIDRLKNLDLDALVVYDVQDESARTSEPRPFPFMGALDPYTFASQYLQAYQIPKIVYRPASKFTESELSEWLKDVHTEGFMPIFVGVPAPDFVPKTSLKQAYQLWQNDPNKTVIGAITIPERHAVLHDEQIRMADKMASGVSYFISQCVFNVTYAKQMVDDLAAYCHKEYAELPTVIFTLTTCGSAKVLNFMEWLGIHVPDNVKSQLLQSENILEKSYELCLNIANELTEFCIQKGVPFGFNIESVAIRKEEIEASVSMVNQVSELLKTKGLR